MSITPVQNSVIQTPNIFQKAKQLLSHRDVRIASVMAVAFTALFCTYLNQDKIMVYYNGYFNPKIDQQCVKDLSKELNGLSPNHCAMKTMSAFGGIRGYCSLPKLDRNKPTVITDLKQVSDPLTRSTFQDTHWLNIKTEIVCDVSGYSSVKCPDKHISVEHFIWNKEACNSSYAPTRFFSHLNRDDRMQILESLYTKGSAVIRRTSGCNQWIEGVAMLPDNYSIKLKSLSDS